MSQPGSVADNVKQQADIVRLIGDYVKLKKAGAQNWSGLCPFHQEKSPSFSVHQTRQFFHCFGCGVSGDIFSFVQKMENVSFMEALKTVAQKFNIALPKQSFNSPAEARESEERGQLLELQEKACDFFQEQLRKPEGARAREYLAARGLDEKAIALFRIGFAPESGFLLRDRLRGSADEPTLRASGLFSWKQEEAEAQAPGAIYSKFRNRVTFPICNEQGRVIAFTARTLATDEKAGPKYLNSPETAIYSKGRVLFNLDKAKEAIKATQYAVLVEGQMDCLSLYVAGFKNVIATSGTAFTETQVRLLGRFTKNVVVNFDPDNAGAAAAERSLAMLLEDEFRVKVLALEAGYDPDLFVRRKGKEEYGKALLAAPDYFAWLTERARMKFPVRTAEGKAAAAGFLLPFIKRVPSAIVRDELVSDMAQKLGIDSAILRKELKFVAANRGAPVRLAAEAQITHAEKVLLRALAPGSDPAIRMRAEEVLESEGLHHGLATEALIQGMLERQGGSEDPLEIATSDSERKLLASVLMQEQDDISEELLQDSMAALRHRGLERAQRELKASLAEAERKGDTAKVAALLQEKLRIDRALTTLANEIPAYAARK